MWDDQDGGPGSVGFVLSWDAATLWAKVQWNLGHINSYRIGTEGQYDLKHVGSMQYMQERTAALTGGVGAIKARHLQCSFAYACGLKKSHLSLFDIKEDLCMAVGGFAHGQRVIDKDGRQSVVIGVKPTGGKKLALFFHL